MVIINFVFIAWSEFLFAVWTIVDYFVLYILVKNLRAFFFHFNRSKIKIQNQILIFYIYSSLKKIHIYILLSLLHREIYFFFLFFFWKAFGFRLARILVQHVCLKT